MSCGWPVVGQISDDMWAGHLAYWDSVNDDLGGVGGRFEVELVAVDSIREAMAVGALAVGIDVGDDAGTVLELLVAPPAPLLAGRRGKRTRGYSNGGTRLTGPAAPSLSCPMSRLRRRTRWWGSMTSCGWHGWPARTSRANLSRPARLPLVADQVCPAVTLAASLPSLLMASKASEVPA